MEDLSVPGDPYASQVVDLMNDRRRAAGLPKLIWNQKISNVSQDWANQLGVATKNPSWDLAAIHRPDAGGSMIPGGFDWYSEIIGFNWTAQNIVDWWMNSPAHKAAILNPLASDIGVGFVVPTDGPYVGWHLVVSNLAGYPSNRFPSQPEAGAAAIAAKYAQFPSIGPAFGPVVCGMALDGCYQSYGSGAIVWTPLLGAHTSLGGIRQVWGAYGFETGMLGYPVTDEIGGMMRGGVYQMFQGGAIVWSPTTGSHVSVGGIRVVWGSSGYETGPLGYPKTDEIGGLVNGGVHQLFEGGEIIWSPKNGAYICTGGIGQTWGSQGHESGRLGYPVSNERPTGGGAIVQDFQGGRITWTPSAGTTVILR